MYEFIFKNFVNIIIIVIITLSFYFGRVYQKKGDIKKTEFNYNVENLKNAIFAYALNKMQMLKMDDNYDEWEKNIDYKSFDGTKLPTLNGIDLTDACFSYIHKISWKYNNSVYHEKLKAIDRYFDKNLNTKEKVEDFFDKFIVLTSNFDAHPPSVGVTQNTTNASETSNANETNNIDNDKTNECL